MIHIYKAGGIRKKDGKEYTVKAINEGDRALFFADGWVASLDNIKKPKAKAKKPSKKAIQDDNQE
jgi:hypothetical protein|tara:strand:- start:187 stop:381 length:195 start_codon:yes stop_codon:yes gene_type:complete